MLTGSLAKNMFRMKPQLYIYFALVSLTCGATTNAATSSDDQSRLVAQANALVAKTDYLQAEAIYSRLIRDDPDCGIYWANRGVIRTLEKQYKTAETDFLTALQISTDDAFAMTGLGRLYIRIGKLDYAEWYLIHALQINPEDTVAIQELSLLHEIQNKKG